MNDVGENMCARWRIPYKGTDFHTYIHTCVHMYDDKAVNKLADGGLVYESLASDSLIDDKLADGSLPHDSLSPCSLADDAGCQYNSLSDDSLCCS